MTATQTTPATSGEKLLGRVAFDYKGDLEDAAWLWNVWTNGEYLPLDRVAETQGNWPSVSMK